MKRMTLIACVAAALGACGEAEPPSVSANAQSQAPVLPANAVEAPPAEAAPKAAAPARLLLSAEGLVAAREGEPQATLAFGRPRAEIDAAMTALRGRPTGRTTGEDCPPGPMEFTSFGDLTLNYQDGAFVGWSLDGSDPPLRDSRGIGVGTGRAELDRRGATFGESTLGFEFGLGEIYGLMSGEEADARVTNLWAGTVCQFT